MVVSKNYVDELENIKKFLLEFKLENNDGTFTSPYTDKLISLAHKQQCSITIELDHVYRFDESLALSIENNVKRFVNLFSDAIFELLPRFRFIEVEKKDFLDMFIEHRILAQQKLQNNQQEDLSIFPKELLKRFDVYFNHHYTNKPLSIREIKSEAIGKLVNIKGLVIRCSDVKPLAVVVTYVCDKCGAETFQPVNGAVFTPLDICPSKQCTINKLGGRLILQTRGSKFTKHQEIKIQEQSDQTPVGSVPRTINIVAYGDLTRLVTPGSCVNITGIFLPVAKSGFRQILQGLISETYIEAHQIVEVNKQAPSDLSNNENLDEDALKLLSEPNLYEKLAYSICPEIYGHEDIKKALLLLMVGGVKIQNSGMKIRGNINILLMGDPGVAKSQLLTYIDMLATRSQLTTGKGSSGVGLTAAIVRDPITNEVSLEGGSLVLADQGVCCIDEFDKMDENDRTAIHEVMEQQTVSIAKAGINTTLNARVSILAAANPIYGRYNVGKSIEHNIQLPAALLSRFDLIWLIKDKVEPSNDLKLAEHIAHVHKYGVHPVSIYDAIPMQLMRKFIALCQVKNPEIPIGLVDFVVTSYVEMRKDFRSGKDNSYVSARTLLSIVRLSTALAKLRTADYVEQEDIQEAVRLMECSKASIMFQNHHKTRQTVTPTDAIYNIIKDFSKETNSASLDFENVKLLVLSRGFTVDQFDQCVEDYQDLNVWLLNSNKTKLNIII